MLDVTGIFTYMYHKFGPNVGKYSSFVENMGKTDCVEYWVLVTFFRLKEELQSVEANGTRRSIVRTSLDGGLLYIPMTGGTLQGGPQTVLVINGIMLPL